ncbi:MAG: ATP-binding protein [Candidatus Riflebacteria bacterium]|nr:ATP-binding protein [Candidatus Riflebacteria bacterium]
MVDRPFWVRRIEQAWQETPIVWLAGVRRSGKTTLAKSLGSERTLYVNCDLPSATAGLANPELFYRDCERPVVVFDEIHQLGDPSRTLKIGADEFPHLKILATGSSTLAASRKFRDTLTGRKRLVRLTPVLWDELASFGGASLRRRLHVGGLPQALLAREKVPEFYREWMDSFFARDVQRLFAFRDPDKFNAVFEYVLRQSGGLLETARASRLLGIGRQTVVSHLSALETTHALTLVRPFHAGGQKELVKVPKAYAFDTGFVSFCRGWDPLRPDDCGVLWEHVVLEYLQAHAHPWTIRYWRDTGGREIDFVVQRSRDEVDAIECKWDPAQFDAAALRVFRGHYPRGMNYLVVPLDPRGHVKRVSGLEVHVCDPDGWLRDVERRGQGRG